MELSADEAILYSSLTCLCTAQDCGAVGRRGHSVLLTDMSVLLRIVELSADEAILYSSLTRLCTAQDSGAVGRRGHSVLLSDISVYCSG